MKNVFAAFTSLCMLQFTLAVVQPQQTQAYSQTQAVSATPLRVVVLPFENLTRQDQDAWLSQSFAESLTMGLTQVKALQIIERSQIDKLLKEQQFSQSAFADPQSAPTLGKMLGANVVAVGSFQKMGEQLQANVRFVDVETGKIDNQRIAQVEGAFSQIFKLQKDLAQTMVQQLDVKTSPAEVSQVNAAMTTTSSTEAHRLYIEGLTYLRYEGKVNLEQAEKHFEAALAYDPKYAEAYAGLARLHLRFASLENSHLTTSPDPQNTSQNHERLAEENIRKAMALKPRLSEVYLAAGGLHKLRGEMDEALKMTRAALQLNPQSEEAINVYLNIRLIQTQFQVSVDELLKEFKALGVNPEDPWLKFNLSAASLFESFDPINSQGNARREWSKKLLLEAQRDLPQYPGIPLVLAGIALEEGDRTAALAYTEQVIRLSDNYPYNLVSAARLLLGLNQKEKALQLLEATEIRFPENRQLKITKAMLLYDSPRRAEAKALFQDLRKTAPEDPFVPFNQGLSAMVYEKDYPAAIAYFKTAKQLYSPQKINFSENFINSMLSTAYLNTHNYREAIPLFEQQLKDPIFRRTAYEGLALSYSRLERHAEALQTYQDYLALYSDMAAQESKQRQLKIYHLRYALAQQPQNAALLNDLAQHLQMQSRFDEALEYYEKALSLAPQEPVIAFNLGSLFLELEQPEKAVPLLEKAVQLRPNYPNAWTNLGLAYQKQGNAQAAEAALKKAKAFKEL